jgi:hypothetical protein
MLINLRNALMTGGKPTARNYIQLQQGAIFVGSLTNVDRVVVVFTNDNSPDTSATNRPTLCGFTNSSYCYYSYYGGTGSSENWLGYTGRVTTTDGLAHVLDWQNNTPGTIDGTVVRPNWKTSFGNNNLTVGYTRIGGVTLANCWAGKIFFVEFYDGNNALMARYIPDRARNSLKNEATGVACAKIGTATYGNDWKYPIPAE